ncbi:MAG TPA: right-handed parallel beta-helix repeat-containing protein [Candidatus Limnocylindria bacterium]|jgi:hypothetical protein|nr:right-handed parallel beta-helix repeat-containing protein [Candidatus Limnocylindria bacterium]
MKTILVSALFAAAACHSVLRAEELYIDPLKGHDDGPGTLQEPYATLARAVNVANALTGNGPVTLKLFPGLYVLNDKVTLKPARTTSATARFTVEAVILPDEKEWSPAKMPVIQSVSANNSTAQFPHSTGFLVSASYVSLRGLKFLGNPNPSVVYYYPVTKEDESLQAMEVSQCYFISEKNSIPIQGGIWAQGPETDINHCVFYNCRNAILLFKSVAGFSITHTIMYGANESAIWMGPIESGFVFKNNVVTHCHYFWVRPEKSTPSYAFSDCLITGNEAYTGFYTNMGLAPASPESDHNLKETNIAKTGKVTLVEKSEESLPVGYLNLAPGSDGYGLGAGIFKAPRGK